MTDEIEWWDSLEGDQIHINTAGYPPYRLEPVVERIVDTLDIPHWVDLGCGVGRLTNAVAERVYPYCKIIGIDPSPKFIMEARRTAAPGARYGLSDGVTIGHLPIHPISGVYSVTVFQHIPHETMWGYIHQVHDLLLPSGVFLFTIALGDEDGFLNHQIKDPDEFCSELAEVFGCIVQHPPDENNWTWIEAIK